MRPNYAMSGKAGPAASDALARSNSVVSTGSRRSYAYTMDVAPGKNTQRKQNQNFSVSRVSDSLCSSLCLPPSCSRSPPGCQCKQSPAACLQQAPKRRLCIRVQPDFVQPGVHGLLAVLDGMLQQLSSDTWHLGQPCACLQTVDASDHSSEGMGERRGVDQVSTSSGSQASMLSMGSSGRLMLHALARALIGLCRQLGQLPACTCTFPPAHTRAAKACVHVGILLAGVLSLLVPSLMLTPCTSGPAGQEVATLLRPSKSSNTGRK